MIFYLSERGKKMLNDKVYNVLKWAGLIALPALAVFVATIGPAWGIEQTDNIVTTLNALGALIGALIGVFGCAKLIRFLLAKYEMPTYSAILGFVIGSIPAVFPGWNAIGIGAVICFAAGLAAILICNKISPEE